jgi:PPIC-type PPIASE domain
LATVAGKSIEMAEVEHQMLLASPREPLPDPPTYSRCAERLAATTTAKAGAAGLGSNATRLRSACRQHYEELLHDALTKTIHTQWLIGEATELGVHVSQQEVREEFELSRKSFKTSAAFAAYRKGTGQSIADMMSEIKLGKVADAIFKKVGEKDHPADGAEVASYYRRHLDQFTLRRGRDVRIVRTTTADAAVSVKRELESGTSFATVARELSAVGQPVGSKSGTVTALRPHFYAEKALNDAIFRARLHHIYGPVKVTATHKTIAPETNSGFFVFEVTRRVPGERTPLGAVSDAIAQQLTKANQQRTLATFIAAFKRKWRARSSCQPGYVVQNCRQFKPTTANHAEDPYTL